MAKEQPIEIFMPPNVLKAKVGGSGSGLDMDAVKRAEKAMERLKSEFGEWIASDVARLVECRDTYAKDMTEPARGDLYRAAHDLRGQALTFEFPLVARVAKSLCRLLDGHSGDLPVALIDAHVDAIRVIVRQNIKDTKDKIALTLAVELESRVTDILKA